MSDGLELVRLLIKTGLRVVRAAASAWVKFFRLNLLKVKSNFD